MWFLKNPNKNPAPPIDHVDAVSLFSRWQSIADNDPVHLGTCEPQGDSILEKALWTMLTARLDFVIGFSRSWLKERIDTHIAPLVKDHSTELNRQFRKSHRKDRYGVLDDSGWFSEREYFFEQIIAPVIGPLIEELKHLFKGATKEAADKHINEIFQVLDERKLPGETTLIEAPKVPIDIVERLRKVDAIHTIDTLFFEWLISRDRYGEIDNLTAMFNMFVQGPTLKAINDIVEGVITDKDTDSASTDDSHDVFSMSPYEYEEYCAEILSKNGWTAKATKKSGDQGADVYAERDGISVVIQCKLTNAPVGNKAVQEIISGQKYMSADYAAVVSPAAYTPGAKDLAKTAHVLLLDHDDLKDLAHIITLTL